MNALNIISELGHNADLLTRSDEWLEMQRKLLSSHMSRIAEELDCVQIAQRIKQKLQQHNLATVQILQRTTDGDISDIVLDVRPLPDAIHHIMHQTYDKLDAMNAATQLAVWNSDGYDIPTAATLR